MRKCWRIRCRHKQQQQQQQQQQQHPLQPHSLRPSSQPRGCRHRITVRQTGKDWNSDGIVGLDAERLQAVGVSCIIVCTQMRSKQRMRQLWLHRTWMFLCFPGIALIICSTAAAKFSAFFSTENFEFPKRSMLQLPAATYSSAHFLARSTCSFRFFLVHCSMT